jgi:hypothetical protein
MMDALLLVWAVVSFWALGQIWLAQVVIYPLFLRVGATEYTDYHRFYARHIPLPVIAPGFASFVLPAPLAMFCPLVPDWMHVANIGLGVVGLTVTLGMEIPRHAKLANDGKDPEVIAELIRYNWPRTASISLQAAVTAGMLNHVLASR